MKIHGNKPPEKKDLSQIVSAGKNKAAEKATPVEKSGEKDMVNLSKEAKELIKLKALIDQLPDIRTEKIEALKKAIESGSYTVDSLKLAEKILEEM